VQQKDKQIDSKRVFLLGEEPDGAQFALIDQSDGAGVEIIQQPLGHYDAPMHKQVKTTEWHFRQDQASNG
jgi:hypothetical protein